MLASIRNRIRIFNKHILNKLFMTFAGSSRTPFAIVKHVGRRSGKPYETPIIVQRHGESFVIALTYGPEVDWYRNVQAAGGCVIRWHGQDYSVGRIETLSIEEGLKGFGAIYQPILRLMHVQPFVRMSAASV
jgi:deazaflavin-dependent oxidoreductase (nitroreductase family)